MGSNVWDYKTLMIHYPHPRFLTGLKTAGTGSFRLAASKLFGVYGNNAQNINWNSLNIIISDDGKSFVQVDQDGAEALCVAYEAPAGRLRELFNLGVKSHFYVCLLLFLKDWTAAVPGVDYMKLTPAELIARLEWPALKAEMKAHPTHYDTAKVCCHMSNYGASAHRFQKTVLKLSKGKIVLSYEQAHYYLTFYHALFPEIRIWHQQIIDEVHRTRQLRNFFGYPRRFDRLWADSYHREIFSWIPQSTVGCITHQASLRMRHYCLEHRSDWEVLNNKHDSFLLQVPDADVEEAKQKGVEFMSIKLQNRRGEEFSMKANASSGKNWKID